MKTLIYFFTVYISDKEGIDYVLDCLGVNYDSAISGALCKYYVKGESIVLARVYNAVKLKIV